MALAALAIGTSAFAGPTIKNRVKTHFASSFANAENVTWNSNGKFDQATFILNNEKVTAYYDTYGALVGTTKNVAFDKLPKAAIESLVSTFTFPEYSLKDCIEFTNADGIKKFYTSFESDDTTVMLEISENGRVDVFTGSAIQ